MSTRCLVIINIWTCRENVSRSLRSGSPSAFSHPI
jgi:hypothetical protein